MPKIYWYYGLVIIGSIMLIYTVYKKKNIPDIISFFSFTTAVSWMIEGVILFILDAYAYKPGLFQDPFAENIIGHMIANTALWGSTAILVMFFQISNPWLCFVSVSFMLIEEFFLKIDAYEQNWWKTYMTGIGVFLFMLVMKKWYSRFYRNGHKLHRVITFWMIAWFFIKIPTSILTVLGKVFYNVDWYDNIYRSSALYGAFVYDAFMASIFTLFVSVFKKTYWCIVPIIIIVVGDIFLYYMDILTFHNGWNLIYLIIFQTLSLGLFILCEKFTLKPLHN
ncbi:hypothetical protein [Brevibacillus dissolubilis]|uniref:hypothetical protein n=1 Tax=Brevibacillus dissolubilis TaxID=1844116 RepID=UPI0011169ABD|nr:hypothetical protein [Brevibacillus dissolubilis]